VKWNRTTEQDNAGKAITVHRSDARHVIVPEVAHADRATNDAGEPIGAMRPARGYEALRPDGTRIDGPTEGLHATVAAAKTACRIDAGEIGGDVATVRQRREQGNQ